MSWATELVSAVMQDYVSKLAVLLVNAKGDPDSAAGAEVQVSKLPVAKLHDAYRA